MEKPQTNIDFILPKMRGADAAKILRDLMLRNCGYAVESLAATDALKNETLGAVYSAFKRSGWLSSASLNAVISQTLQHLAVVQPVTVPAHRQFLRMEPAKDFKPSSVIHSLVGIVCNEIVENENIPASAINPTIEQTNGLISYGTIISLSRDAVFNSAGAILPGAINGLINSAFQVERDLIAALLNSASVTPTTGGIDNLAGLLDAWHNSSVLNPRFIVCNPTAQVSLATKINQAGLNLIVVPLKGLTNTFIFPDRESSPVSLLTLGGADHSNSEHPNQL